ncbi:MAG: DUF6112 family protein [Nocardioides sp.]|uniref:DUF6112 family protein n=1 Tax=Nocardioides sp. TaxID=35761 RepID=UPI0039E49DED
MTGLLTAPVLATSVGPDFGAVSGSSQLRSIIGALLTYGLLVSVLMIVVCAATWAIASSSGSWQATAKAKAGLFVALGGAVLTGGALAWANWLLHLGATL